MEKKITKITAANSQMPKAARVAAYARVSSGKDAMLHSLSAQVSYYSGMIQNHKGWEYAGVYADEALTGTKEDRQSFQRLLSDCRSGKIDKIITKSISRFARNTVTLLETVRELKLLDIDVFFEEQNIHTMSAEGELMLTILASYAQEESRSVSENMKWRVRENFKNGKPWNGTMLGYKLVDGKLEVVPKEAETVKRIFELYLSGLGYSAIAKELNQDGVPTRFGNKWTHPTVCRVICNIDYTGNLLLQKTYRSNHIAKTRCVNNGELPMYSVEEAHEPIIDTQTFMAAQLEKKRRSEIYHKIGTPKQNYPFSGMVRCGLCGKNYRRKVKESGAVWICDTYNTHGKDACCSKAIPEDQLYSLTVQTLGMTEFSYNALNDKITEIVAERDNTLLFRFKDGKETVKQWKSRSRADSWTDEMKEKARQQAFERRKADGQ